MSEDEPFDLAEPIRVPNPLPPLLLVEEVAAVARVTPASVTRAIRAGELRASKAGMPYRVPLVAICDWLGLELDDLRSRCTALSIGETVG